MHKLSRVMLLAAWLLPALPVQAGFEDGVAAYLKGDYLSALRELKPLAEQGHSAAQYHLGLMYGLGRGVPVDPREAVRWYRQAAEQGVAMAQYNLGVLYETGAGVPQDDREAVSWFRKAAERGIVQAHLNLGLMYFQGLGVPELPVVAFVLFSLAAAQGDRNAIESRALLMPSLSPKELEDAQQLLKEMSRPGNFNQALDDYVRSLARGRR